MNQKKLITFVYVALSAFSALFAKEQNVTMGKKVNVQSYTVSTTELFSKMSRHCHKAHCDKQCIADPGCIVDSPIDPFRLTVQNPNAPAVAFFPNAGASNQLKQPTQSVGFKFSVGTIPFFPDQVSPVPDTMGVAGPEQFIVAINNGIISFDKKTGKRDWILNSGGSEFGILNNEVEDATFYADPRIRFDVFSKRWYIIYLITDPATFVDNGFYLAVSDGSVITQCTQWKLLFIPNNTLVPNPEGCIGDLGAFFDYPQMGIDKHAVYIVGNMIRDADFTTGSTVFVIPKEQLLCDSEPVITAFRDIGFGFADLSTNTFSLTPDNFDKDSKFGYIIQQIPYTFGKLILWRIVNPGTDHPSLAGPFPIDVPTFAFDGKFFSVPEKNNVYGLAGQLATVDYRPMQAVVRNHQLYMVMGTVVDKNGVSVWDEINQRALGDRWGVRWHQIDVTGDPTGNAGNSENANTAPALVQAGTLFDARDTDTPLAYIMPSIMTNKHEDMVISATLTGLDSVAKAFFVGRRKSDPLGTLRVGPNYEGTVFAESSGIFTITAPSFVFVVNGIDVAGQRWGDYSMVSVDPVDDTTIWTIQEVHRGNLPELWVARLDR